VTSQRAITVVGLRMWCDFIPIDEYTYVGRSMFQVFEFAVLSDGREIRLIDDRGWGGWTTGLSLEQHLSQLTVHDIEQSVFGVLLPDWADVHNPLPPELAAVEAIGGAQDWSLLSQRLRDHGIEATPDALQKVPRRVDISDRTRRHLRDASG
jgi:hypothetical protein